VIIFLLQTLIQLAIILPVIIILAEKKKGNILRIILFCLCAALYTMILILPFFFKPFFIIKGTMNWNGKILSVIFWTSAYFFLRKYFVNNDFFRIKQEKQNLKITVSVSIAWIIFILIFYALPQNGIEFNIEGLLFDLTMPGTDEEIFFRCILLGLLSGCLKNKKIFFVDISVLILAVYFGLGHALMLSPDYSLNFALKYFIYAGTWGYVQGWITIKNRSILIPVIVHNIADFLVDLTVMIKSTTSP
jgi:hypothetical protein